MIRTSSLALAMALLAHTAWAQDDSEIVDGKTYVSKSHNITFSLPSADWGSLKVGGDKEWNWPGGLVEGLDSSGNVGLCLAAEKAGMKTEDYIKHFETSMSKIDGTKGFKRTSEAKDGDRLRCEYTWSYKDWEFHYVTIFWTKEKTNYKLCIWVESRLWDDSKDIVNGIVSSLKPAEGGTGSGSGSGTGSGSGSGSGGGTVKHPWSDCGEGSWVEHTISTKMSGMDSEMSTKRTLVKKGSDEFTFKLESKMTKPTSMDMPAQEMKEKAMLQGGSGTGGGAKPKELGKGEEELDIAGKKVKCTWVEMEIDAGGKPMTVKTWSSDQVPGGVVKTVSKNADMESTMVCVGFEKK